MPRQAKTSIENNFSGGLKTEFTVLNFPENACTDTDNCVFNLSGEVIRRLGIDHEENRLSTNFDRTNRAISSYIWNNAGGDGNTRLYVLQTGSTLRFYNIATATVASPLSTKLLVSTINLLSFIPSGSAATVIETECQFTDGNGYLFVFHPDLDPIYCINNAGTITANRINLNIRDTIGIPETEADNFRPTTLSATHQYNLYNQGWTNAAAWTAFDSGTYGIGPLSPAPQFQPGPIAWNVAAGIVGINPGDPVFIRPSFSSNVNGSGTVTSYIGTVLTINVTSANYGGYDGLSTSGWEITKTSQGLIDDWFTAQSNYPSNSDVWWYFKNSSGVFDPAGTAANVTLGGPAPKGSIILEVFNQNRTTVTGIAGLTIISTLKRPRTGCWFSGRVWYTGVDAVFQATGTAPTTSWTETIYFSQIIEKTDQFGKCYQINDPTSEQLFDLLPSDGGTIVIQGCGSIQKLFPIQNGLLVFASNGIWFVTGSQGIGFTANDYTITKISGVTSISGTSFIDVQGYPLFWNEDGIYTVMPGQQGGLTVTNIALNSILSFYQDIPLKSKLYARGSYNPLTYVVQWVFKSTEETDITSRYEFDRILNFNVTKQSFYPWTISVSALNHRIHDCKYVAGASGTPSLFKYIESRFVSAGVYSFTFGEENNTNYKDWQKIDDIGVNFESSFTTGYKLHGNAIRKWQPTYVYMFIDSSSAYRLQGRWEFSSTGNSGRWSSLQLVTNVAHSFNSVVKRHRIRGHGLSLQMHVKSVEGRGFNFAGWTIWETQRSGV